MLYTPISEVERLTVKIGCIEILPVSIRIIELSQSVPNFLNLASKIMQNDFIIRQIDESDKSWIEYALTEYWRSSKVISRGKIFFATSLPGFIAILNGQRSGSITYHIDSGHCEIVTLNSQVEGIGIGSRLIEAVTEIAIASGCCRVWLITTNDNLNALKFYQKRGFHLVAVHPNALEESRRLKPGISEVGLEGIPLRDEIELELPIIAHGKEH
jgi:GNAT superfamily N-acetyltransferase